MMHKYCPCCGSLMTNKKWYNCYVCSKCGYEINVQFELSRSRFRRWL